jgi:integrase
MKKRTLTVTVESRNDLLRLRWNDGRRRSHSLGIPDSVPNRAIAGQIKRQIEHDINDGKFDESLGRYKVHTFGTNKTDVTAPELILAFTAHKIANGTISKHTASIRYARAKQALKAHLNTDITAIDKRAAQKFVDHMAQTLCPAVAKQQLQLLKACWNWGKDSYQLQMNPWENLACNFRAKTTEKPPIEPFTRDEVRSIVAGFEASERYSHYSDFVRFLFGTGCRFGEAAAIRWESIKSAEKSAWICESVSNGYHNPTTKTGKSRSVQLSPALQTMLRARKERLNPSPNDLVFPSHFEHGRAIEGNRFRHYWKIILKSRNVKHRRVYSTRHTAISHALENGANPADVAAQCGHNLQTLYEHYAGVISPKQVFAEF